ncbi:hypothetical protein BDN71DRAFT_1442231 [Pleurotus eryngii]|uniref:Uncharacterized protein n=1 Tax=Pleurotus eryngii TaxID=5323 RepID=A0A9P6DIM7_PLEER|nr:hypothetical protein BDN71DRAFT_1442231 [Pleurotus eryngii]
MGLRLSAFLRAQILHTSSLGFKCMECARTKRVPRLCAALGRCFPRPKGQLARSASCIQGQVPPLPSA